MATETVEKVIKEHLEKVNNRKKSKKKKKKTKKKEDFIYVGIHARRGDHLHYELEKGIKSVKSGYFLEAMELYR